MNSISKFLYGGRQSGIRLLLLSSAMGVCIGLQPGHNLAEVQEKESVKMRRQSKSAEFHENMGSLDVNDSKFSFPEVNLLERTKGKIAPYISEHLRITFRPGEPQDLFVILPAGTKNPPLVLYMFSYPETLARFQAEQWALSAVGRGYAAIGFSSDLSGDGANQTLSREEFQLRLPRSLIRTAHDIQLLLNYLASRGDLNLDRVGLYGSGSGASAAVLASSVDPRIKVLDLSNPWGAWPEFFSKSPFIPAEKRGLFLKSEYLQPLSWLDPAIWFAKSKAASVRIQDVRQQDFVPVAAQEKIENAAPPVAEINQFEDFRTLLEMQGSGMVFSWIQTQLRLDAKPQTEGDKSKRTHYFAGKGHTLGESPLTHN